MEVNILETTIVKPANDKEETSSPPGQRLWLSNLDLVHGRIHLPLLFLYKRDLNSLASHDFFDARLLKEALSRALIPFHPLAGRLARDEEERIEVDCNGKGVLFKEAEAPEIGLDEIDDFMPASELLKLVPRVDYAEEISSYPLLLLQVTRFKCNGVCLGIGTHHSLADGQSAMNFINTWSDMARGLPPIATPFLDRTILQARSPPSPKFHHTEYDPPQTLINNNNNSKNPTQIDPKNLTTMSIVTFTPDQVRALITKCANPSNDHSNVRYSTYQIMTAHIWRCASRARGLADDQPTRLHISVDGRSRLVNRPPFPVHYFGNVIFHATTMVKAGELVSEPIARTVERIRRAINTMDDEYLRSAVDYLEDPNDPAGVMQVPGTCRSPNLKIISWIRLPFEYSDFGWGRPVSYRPANLFEGKGNLMHGTDGSLSLVICLEEGAMVAFRKLVHDDDVGGCCSERSATSSRL
ncbi:unnamed protein product [Linum trigynum]|uniref:Uncharacterized protein n=1 Tax=Linum trigynum TaxID=586398 RepID=A0AAV2CSJ9_9ROSI